jgi:glyceraldehyde 3-phosphate dehydrogenase
VDAPNVKIMEGTLIKLLLWYDNEWGYSCRCMDLIKYIGK